MDSSSLTSLNTAHAAIIVANMLQDYLEKNKMISTQREKLNHDDRNQNSTPTHGQTSVYLPSAIDDGTSTLQSGKYSAPICSSRQGTADGMASTSNQNIG